MQISDIQRELLADMEPRDFSLYVSIPYCPSRCSYCSFVSHSIDHPKAKKLLPDYLNHLVQEIAFTANLARETGLRLRSVYIGGGTPTSLTAEQLKQETGRGPGSTLTLRRTWNTPSRPAGRTPSPRKSSG